VQLVEALRSCRKAASSIPDEVIGFFSELPSSNIMALWLPQPVTEMSTRNLPGGGKARPARKADHLTAIHEKIIQKM
jgi:hypothetical protein